MNNEIERLLIEKGMNIVRFVDISGLSVEQTQGFTKAILFCSALSKDYILDKRNNKKTEHEDFVEKENKTDALADWLAEYLRAKGYRAYSQSEKSHADNGNYDPATLTSILPHKTIALLSGIGYIGKNNLLITKQYGCAFSMCTVLTDVPIKTDKISFVPSTCNGCDICKQVCLDGAILGKEWSKETSREGVLDVHKCKCELKCVVNCPQTLKYALQQA